MFSYVCFYKGKEITVQASSSYNAQQEAARIFRARKPYEVTVMLAAIGDQPYIHHPATL